MNYGVMSDHSSYIFAGYLLVCLSLAGYGMWLLKQRRDLNLRLLAAKKSNTPSS